MPPVAPVGPRLARNLPGAVASPASAMTLALALALALVLAIGSRPGAALAAEPDPATADAPAATLAISIPPGPLAEALNRFALQAGVAIAMDANQLAGLQSPGLDGQFTPDQGLARLLAGSGFRALSTPSGYVLEALPRPRAPAGAAGAATLPAVDVRAVRSSPEALPEAFAGGQVARGARLGLLGNRDVMDTPFNQTSFTSEFIANRQARTLADVVANDPSVAIDNPTAAGWEAAVIRGFATGDGTGAVAVNGLYGIVPDDAIAAGWVERVEILKGPGVLLNGMPTADAIGGSINLVTKRADDEPLAELGLNYASNRQVGISTELGRRFGPDGALGLRFSGQWRNGEVPVEPTRERLGYGVLGLDYRSSRVRVSADLGRQERTLTGANRPLFLGSAPIPRVPRNDRSYLPGWTVWNSGGTFGMIQAEWDLSERVTAHAAWGMRRTDGKEVLFVNPELLDGNGDWEATPSLTNSESTSRSATAGLRWQFDTGPIRHQFATNVAWIGQANKSAQTWGNVYEFRSNLYQPIAIERPDITVAPVARSSETRRSSLGFADTLSILGDRIQLTVGARRQTVASRSFSVTTGAETSAYDSHVWSPAAALIVKPLDHVSLYANYIEGLQPGQIVSDNYLNAGEVFAPYQTEQVEAGVKTEWSPRLITTVSIFQIARPSTVEVPTAPAPTLALDGEQRNRGLELNVFGEPLAGVRLTGGLMAIDAKLRKTQDGENDGNRAPAVPRWRLALGGEWDTGFTPGLTLTARVRYSGRVHVDNGNTRSVPAWAFYDLGARYRFDSPWGKDATLRLAIENVFDRNVWIGRTAGIYQSSPRTLLLSVSSRF